jgi:hypothetical protein
MRTASEAEFDKPFIEGKLTPVAVRNARKPGLYGDGHGLYLQVSKFETKSWIFRYMIEGRARKMGLVSRSINYYDYPAMMELRDEQNGDCY